MKKVITCPTCGGHVVEFDCLDTMIEDTKVTLFKVGECDHCGNHYQWHEEFVFSAAIKMEQIEKEEEIDLDDYEPGYDECGFDPYEGCYTYDC